VDISRVRAAFYDVNAKLVNSAFQKTDNVSGFIGNRENPISALGFQPDTIKKLHNRGRRELPYGGIKKFRIRKYIFQYRFSVAVIRNVTASFSGKSYLMSEVIRAAALNKRNLRAEFRGGDCRHQPRGSAADYRYIQYKLPNQLFSK
jgi:ribosomal protein S6